MPRAGPRTLRRTHRRPPSARPSASTRARNSGSSGSMCGIRSGWVRNALTNCVRRQLGRTHRRLAELRRRFEHHREHTFGVQRRQVQRARAAERRPHQVERVEPDRGRDQRHLLGEPVEVGDVVGLRTPPGELDHDHAVARAPAGRGRSAYVAHRRRADRATARPRRPRSRSRRSLRPRPCADGTPRPRRAQRCRSRCRSPCSRHHATHHASLCTTGTTSSPISFSVASIVSWAIGMTPPIEISSRPMPSTRDASAIWAFTVSGEP